jgi:hypothetical protein
MRILPNHRRLRMVAIVCWALGAWWLLQPQLLQRFGLPPILGAWGLVLASLILATGAAFWLLATDRRASVIVDRKGLALNLGYSAAFVGWDNLAALGVIQRRSSLLALGSGAQLGIRLYRPEPYLQSYERRLPASPGLIGHGVRLVRRLTGGEQATGEPGLDSVAALRRRTGYDIVIPEAQIGMRAEVFVALLESYRPALATAR